MRYGGFDIGGTKCAVSIGEYTQDNIKILCRKEIPTDLSISPYKMLDRLCDSLESMPYTTGVIGISCGGPLDSKNGIILSPPNLPHWDNIEIVRYISQKLNTEVYLENDANACAIAEWKFGAGRGSKNMIFLTFGTGLGAGLILDGNLYKGTNSMAGEVGHICLERFGPVGYGKSGSFEGFCSGGGITQLAKTYALEKLQAGKTVSFCTDLSHANSLTAKDVAEYAADGNEDAKEVFSLCGKMLGKGLSILIDILNPEIIVLGSIYQRCEYLLQDAMQEVIEKEALPLSASVCKILPAALKDNVGDYAALSVAILNKEMQRWKIY